MEEKPLTKKATVSTKRKSKEKPKAINPHEREIRRKIEDWNIQRQLDKESEL